MPLEIRELIIKATVDNSGSNAQSGTTGTEGTSETNLNEVAEKVFEIIKEKSER